MKEIDAELFGMVLKSIAIKGFKDMKKTINVVIVISLTM